MNFLLFFKKIPMSLSAFGFRKCLSTTQRQINFFLHLQILILKRQCFLPPPVQDPYLYVLFLLCYFYQVHLIGKNSRDILQYNLKKNQAALFPHVFFDKKKRIKLIANLILFKGRPSFLQPGNLKSTDCPRIFEKIYQRLALSSLMATIFVNI